MVQQGDIEHDSFLSSRYGNIRSNRNQWDRWSILGGRNGRDRDGRRGSNCCCKGLAVKIICYICDRYGRKSYECKKKIAIQGSATNLFYHPVESGSNEDHHSYIFTISLVNKIHIGLYYLIANLISTLFTAQACLPISDK